MADSIFTSNEGYSAAHTHTRAYARIHTQEMHTCTCCRVPPQRPLPSCCHVSMRALATVSKRANRKRRSWWEPGREEWVKRRGKREVGGGGINKWWVQQCELLLVSIAAAPPSFAWQPRKTNPLDLRHFLSCSVSLRYQFPSHFHSVFFFNLFLSPPRLPVVLPACQNIYILSLSPF